MLSFRDPRPHQGPTDFSVGERPGRDMKGGRGGSSVSRGSEPHIRSFPREAGVEEDETE